MHPIKISQVVCYLNHTKSSLVRSIISVTHGSVQREAADFIGGGGSILAHESKSDFTAVRLDDAVPIILIIRRSQGRSRRSEDGVPAVIQDLARSLCPLHI